MLTQREFDPAEFDRAEFDRAWKESQRRPELEAVREAERYLKQAEPHLAHALEVLCRAIGIEPAEAWDVDRDDDCTPKGLARDCVVCVLRNVRAAHLHTADCHGT